MTDERRIKGRDGKPDHACARQHREAAELYERSASNHRLAAEAYDRGDEEEAETLAIEAERLHRAGMEHEEEARRRGT